MPARDDDLATSLDLLRVLAALFVFLSHCTLLGVDGGALSFVRQDVGHSMVIVFFVLSGYVIAGSVSGGASLKGYAVKRISRVYSVAVPALLLTWLIDRTLTAVGATASEMPAYALHKPLIYSGISLAFAGDFWNLAVPAFSDGPWWSLGYEVWYYALFGLAALALTPWRWLAVPLLLLAMGPKLCLLLPVWLGGVAVFRLRPHVHLPRLTARTAALASLVAFLAIKYWLLEDPINDAARTFLERWIPFPLRFSQWFAGDYLVAVLTALLVLTLPHVALRYPPPVARLVRTMAGLTFGLYLMHYPLLIAFRAMFAGHVVFAIPAAFGCALLFAAMAEPQKRRLRQFLLAVAPGPRSTATAASPAA